MRRKKNKPEPAPITPHQPDTRYKIRVEPEIDRATAEIVAWKADVGRWNYSWMSGHNSWDSYRVFQGQDRQAVVTEAQHHAAKLEAIPDMETI